MNKDPDKEKKEAKSLTPAQAKLKASSFCAYQERTQQEVRDKLYSYGLHKKDVEEILSFLISEDFINEERFAKAYAGGKFRIKKWGRIRIERELVSRKISPYCIKKAMEEISDDDYQNTLLDLAEKKMKSIYSLDPFQSKKKTSMYLISKGFEPQLVWDCLKCNFR